MEATALMPDAKKMNVSNVKEAGKGEDRISNLPDTILHHILSFLPTKYAVGTSILCTRWKYLWTSLHNLDFDFELLFSPEKSNGDSMGVSRFMNFVDRVLIFQDMLSIEKFHLRCGKNCDSSRVNAWICIALRRKVRKLDLRISRKQSVGLPRCLFTCQSLVILKLGKHFVLNIPSSICLPSLKFLHLNSVIFLDDDSTQKLISGCPVLQDLIIESCGWENIRNFNISTSALKRLTIDQPECIDIRYNTDIREYKITINAPNLVSFKYIDFVAEDYSLGNLPSLVEATIHVALNEDQYDTRSGKHGDCVSKLLRQISEVQFLSLSGDTMEALTIADNYYLGTFHNLKNLPTFYNLNHLELGVNNGCGWELLPDLLKCSPNLEVLVFMAGLVFDDEPCLDQFGPPQSVPLCLLHLKVIEIRYFEGRYDEEVELVKYFLKNAKVLKRVTIISYEDDLKKQLDVSSKLLMLRRASRRCIIEFPGTAKIFSEERERLEIDDYHFL